jgi:hypothetical protein
VGGAKEDLGRPAPGEGHEAHAFLEVAVAGEEFESRLDEGFGIERDEIGLVVVDALVVGGVERAGFLWIEGQIAEALAGGHFPWAQDQVIGIDGADRVAVFGEGDQGARAAACGKIGRERSDAFKEVLGGRGHRNRGPPVPPVERGETAAW